MGELLIPDFQGSVRVVPTRATDLGNQHLPGGTWEDRGLVRNAERAPAYAMSNEQALAQYAVTGCLNNTFYTRAHLQRAEIVDLARSCDAEFVAQVASYAHQQGRMKEVPALLLAVLAERPDARSAFKQAFVDVVDSGKMLRNFVKYLNPGAHHPELAGLIRRKSLGTAPARMIQQWFDAQSDDALFRQSYGSAPKMRDVINLAHVRPRDDSRRALHGYFGRGNYDETSLPSRLQELIAFRRDSSGPVPNVPFEFVKSMKLSPQQWAEVALSTSWQTLRMNLDLFARRGAFDYPDVVRTVAQRLRDPGEVMKAGVLPHQLLIAYKRAGAVIPAELGDALHDAMEIATRNVPVIPGRVVVCPDVSLSMKDPLTGHRQGATSAVRCVDAAALVTSAIIRKNPDALVLPFEDKVVRIALNPRDSVMANAQLLAEVGGGGTDCSAPLRLLNGSRARVDTVVMISDNESWTRHGLVGTAMGDEWQKLSARNPGARLACIDVTPLRTTQVQSNRDVLNVGGFSDDVFGLISDFVNGKLDGDGWVERIKNWTPPSRANQRQ